LAFYMSLSLSFLSPPLALSLFSLSYLLLLRNRPVLGTLPRNIPGNAYASVPGTFLVLMLLFLERSWSKGEREKRERLM